MSIKILENLWQVGGDNLSASGDAAVYLMCFGDSAALVDAGTGQGHLRIKENIYSCLPPSVSIDYLLLTHCHFDHTGGAEELRRTFGCRIVAHVLDAVYLEEGNDRVTAAAWYGTSLAPLAIDLKVEGEQALIPIDTETVTAIHLPGHSPGSLVYTVTMQDQLVLFGQDVHGPIHPDLESDGQAYQASLEKLLKLEADLLLEGHFGIFRGRQRVRSFIQSYQK